MAEEFRVVPTILITPEQIAPEKSVLLAVRERDITEFCGGCDNFVPDTNGCSVDYLEGANQARYVARDWCGAARVDGVRGQMTTGNGFKAFESRTSTAPSAPLNDSGENILSGNIARKLRPDYSLLILSHISPKQ